MAIGGEWLVNGDTCSIPSHIVKNKELKSWSSTFKGEPGWKLRQKVWFFFFLQKWIQKNALNSAM